eukprot:UN23800
MQDAKLKNMELNIVVYCQAITRLSQNGYLKQSLELFEDFKRTGLPLNNAMYGLMFNVYRKCKDFKTAIVLHEEAKSNKINLNLPAYTALLECYFFEGRLNELLAEMKQIMGFDSFNIVIYNELIRLCKYKKDLDNAMSLFECIKKQNLKPTETTCCNLLSVAKSVAVDDSSKRVVDVDKILPLFQQLDKEGHPLGITSYNTLLSVISKTNNVAQVQELYENMRVMIGIDKLTLNIVADAYANNGFVKKVIEIFEQRKSHLVFMLVLKSIFNNEQMNLETIAELFDKYPDMFKYQQVTATLFSYILQSHNNDITILDKVFAL